MTVSPDLLLHEIERERALDRAAEAAWIRQERSCASSGSLPPPVRRSEAERREAAACRRRRLDRWAEGAEGRARIALSELAAALVEAQALHEQARAAVERDLRGEAALVLDRAHRMQTPLSRAKQAALDLWLASDAAGSFP